MACNYTIITPFYSLKTNSKNEYFYFFNRKNIYEQYMVFKYTSSREGGKLNVQASDEDINKLIPIKYEKFNSLGSISSGFFYLEGKSYLSIRKYPPTYQIARCLSWDATFRTPCKRKVMRFARLCLNGETSMNVADNCMK